MCGRKFELARRDECGPYLAGSLFSPSPSLALWSERLGVCLRWGQKSVLCSCRSSRLTKVEMHQENSCDPAHAGGWLLEPLRVGRAGASSTSRVPQAVGGGVGGLPAHAARRDLVQTSGAGVLGPVRWAGALDDSRQGEREGCGVGSEVEDEDGSRVVVVECCWHYALLLVRRDHTCVILQPSHF